MVRWFKVCAASELKPGQARSVTILTQPYAVFNVNGILHGIHAACGHMKANLAHGKLLGSIVECSMHGWEYDVTTGECLTVPMDPLRIIPVKIESDWVWIGLEWNEP